MNDREQPLPLLELFNRLRKAGLPLGIDEYNLVLQAMQHGFGIADREALARLCRTLWVKSGEETLLFNYHFQQVMDEWKTQVPSIRQLIEPVSESKQKIFQFSTLSFNRTWLISSSMLILIGGWLVTRPPGKQCPYFTSAPPTVATVGEPYNYQAVACKAHETDPPPKITVKKPSWLSDQTNKDGTLTLTGKPTSKMHSFIRRWDLSGKLQAEFLAPNSEDNLQFLKPSPNGKYAVSQQGDRIINLWNFSGGKLLASLMHSGIVAQAVFSPDSKSLATAAGDGLVRVWDLKGEIQQKPTYILPHKERVRNVHFSPNGKHLASLAEGGIVRLWDLSSNQSRVLRHNINWIYGFSHDGQSLIAIDTQNTAELLNLSGKTFSSVSNVIRNNNNDYDYYDSRKQQLIVNKVISEEFIISLQDNRLKNRQTIYLRDWLGKKNTKLYEVEKTDYRVNFLYSLNSNSQLIAGSIHKNKNEVYLWNLSGKQIEILQTKSVVDTINFSPNGQLLVTRSIDGFAQLWDVGGQRGKLILTLPNRILNIMFSSDGKSLISTGISNSDAIKLQVTDTAGNQDTQSFNIQVLEQPTDSETNNQKLIYLAITGGILLLLLAGAYPVARWWLTRNARSNDESFQEPDDPKSSSPVLESKSEPEDEVQVGKAILADRIETSEYFPVTGRQMKQSWRYLRRMIREGSPTELDLEETVKQISKQGLLLNLVLRPRRVNRSELLLLIDQEGSMVPFHALSRRLVDTALQGGRLARVGVHHFHNCPDEYLYNDPRRTEAMAINAILNIYPDSTGVLIFSDAGAAHGGISPERIQLTEEFLARLKQRFRYIAWLNPMPVDRWQGTSAESIARLVPMFEFTRQGLHEAIAVLRGKLVPLSIETDGDPVQNVRSTY
jgi:uncharacterized protein with von Willebrand factor type A (vWA) domain/WD40 repeat protein